MSTTIDATPALTPQSYALTSRNTVPRQTPQASGASFREALRVTGQAVISAVGALAPLAPPVHLASAVRGGLASGVGASSAAGGLTGGATGDPGLDEAWAMQRESQFYNMEFLKLQESMQEENRRFTCLSNVFKARHETMKAAITNIR